MKCKEAVCDGSLAEQRRGGSWLTYPQHPEALRHRPAAQEVDLKVVVQDDDDVLLPKGFHRGLV